MNKGVAEEFQIFCGKDIKPDGWLWCSRCHRCYNANDFRKLKAQRKIFLLCHYRDCDGDLPLDSRSWSRMVEQNPWLPKTLIKGKTYDPGLYPGQEEKAAQPESSTSS